MKLLIVLGGLAVAGGVLAKVADTSLPPWPWPTPSPPGPTSLDQSILYGCVCLEMAHDVRSNADWKFTRQVYDVWQASVIRAFRGIAVNNETKARDDELGKKLEAIAGTDKELTAATRDTMAKAFEEAAK